MPKEIWCDRCNASGEIGIRGEKEEPGPVPDTARGWRAIECPDCRGRGVLLEDEDDEEGEEDDEQST